MDSIHIHDQAAVDYDQQVQQYDSYGHDVLFGLMYEYIQPQHRLLDIGIGTGLSSQPFARAGLTCFGIDGSRDMLTVCHSKHFSAGLVQFDISQPPLPFSDSVFHIVIACGLFHFFSNLEHFFQDIARISTPKCIFGFSVAGIPFAREQQHPAKEILHTPTAWGVNIYQHNDTYIQKLLHAFGFSVLKRQKVLIKSGTPGSEDLLFVVYVTQT